MAYESITPNRYLMQPSDERFGHIGHFSPRSAREEREIARRRAHPRDTLILEEQEKGLVIALAGLEQAASVANVRSWADCVVPALLGSAPYHMNGPVMGRQVPLPMLAHPEPEKRPRSEQLLEQALGSHKQAIELASYLTVAHIVKIPRRQEEKIALKTAKAIAHTGFMIRCIELGDITADPTNGLSNTEVQHMVRDHCMQAVQDTGTLALEIGAFPSAAQLPDRISPLSVEVQRAGSDFACRAYEQAA